MIVIELTFPAGRFHATPWGHHVNEGAVEWPPSPWRFLRALVATWKRKANHLDENLIRELLQALSSPPDFHLPRATFSHTRHYMPWYKKGPGDKTLVFDSFVALQKDEPVRLVWQALNLPQDQRQALELLLSLIGTFGRAESWCDGKLLSSDEAAAIEPNCKPLTTSALEGEAVRVLGVDAETVFSNDLNPRSAQGSLYDPDWHLCMETLWLHKQRFSMPPGAKWLDYSRKKDALALPKPKPQHRARPAMQVARFALDSTVLPLLTDALRVAEAARFNLMGIYGRHNQQGEVKGKSPMLSGKAADGTPLKGHRHCYYLPTSELPENHEKGRIDHLTLFAAGGFSKEDLRAIDRIREIKSRDRQESGHPLRAILLGVGVSSEMQPGPLKPSRSWVSATPFVSPRLPKTSGRHKVRTQEERLRFVEEQLKVELQRWIERNKPEIQLEKVQIQPCVDDSGNTRRRCPLKQGFRERPIQFRRFRQKRTDDGGKRPAAFFQLTFPERVSGPIALGHSCHFGLGLFVPVFEV